MHLNKVLSRAPLFGEDGLTRGIPTAAGPVRPRRSAGISSFTISPCAAPIIVKTLNLKANETRCSLKLLTLPTEKPLPSTWSWGPSWQQGRPPHNSNILSAVWPQKLGSGLNIL